ncbi:hypothetical protein P5673_019000 [Acropora cervicornis]|uniref:Integrase catalytic domain-containing protein n=1 Tax=Acropora cervicornis TaxID=6130 RepID=A0AAD9V2X3_ACRCE|nr:hypothetical protein P5673_019000 [Acropora cervicornis]
MTPEEYAAYDNQLRILLQEGHIEQLPRNCIPESYLPHRGVVKLNRKTTKLRIVHDASAKSEGGLSLIDVLEKEPNLLPLLWGILLRFRIGKVGVLGKIEEYRYRKVIFGAKSLPFLLQAVLKYHLEGFVGKSKMADQLLCNLYMDDPVNSVENTEKAREFWYEAVNIFKDGGFNLRKFRSNDEILLREIADGQVQQFQKIDDPSGLVSPVVTPMKIIVQDLWKEKVGWDEEVNNEFRSRVGEALKGFSGGNHLRINRWLGVTQSLKEYTRVSLHVFTDASSRAYAAAAYLRVTDAEEKVTVNLIASKCRLAPPNGETIPRLELLGALLGARLLNSLKKDYKDFLKIDAEFLWSDSSVALAWINQGPQVGGVFVANRVEEITAVGGVWSWVPTDENPADLPTRGTTVSQLSVRKIWWNGPYCRKPEYLEDIVDPQRTSKYLRTLRSVGWILRWRKSSKNTQTLLTLEELRDAKSVILKQNGGRLQQVEATFEELHPVLVKKCGVLDQLALHIHEQMQHTGTGTVISEVKRQVIWILRSKKTVSSVIRKCRKCSRFLAGPASEQTLPFPRCRVTCRRPFEATGMDLGGPLYLKESCKAWFVVFTCMSVRAIHLEIVTSLSVEALIQALQRFMNRRGVPQLCISDHGTNFVAAAKLVREKNLEIKWQFVVERGPWWGGAWERLVGVVKGPLRRSLGQAVLSWEELVTALTEVEKVINRGLSLICGNRVNQFLLPPRTDGKEEERELNVSKEFQQRKKWLSSMNDLWKKEYLHQKLIIGLDGRCRAAVVQVKSGLLRRPIRKLYKLEICAETDNLPRITSFPESSNVDDDEMQNRTVELMDGEEEAAEGEVPPPRRTLSGREVVRHHRFRDE